MAVLKWRAISVRSATEMDDVLNTQAEEGWTFVFVVTQTMSNSGWVLAFSKEAE